MQDNVDYMLPTSAWSRRQGYAPVAALDWYDTVVTVMYTIFDLLEALTSHSQQVYCVRKPVHDHMCCIARKACCFIESKNFHKSDMTLIGALIDTEVLSQHISED